MHAGDSILATGATGNGRERPSRDEIARLAYHLYETHERRDGHDVDDWLSPKGNSRIIVGSRVHWPRRRRPQVVSSPSRCHKSVRRLVISGYTPATLNRIDSKRNIHHESRHHRRHWADRINS